MSSQVKSLPILQSRSRAGSWESLTSDPQDVGRLAWHLDCLPLVLISCWCCPWQMLRQPLMMRVFVLLSGCLVIAATGQQILDVRLLPQISHCDPRHHTKLLVYHPHKKVRPVRKKLTSIERGRPRYGRKLRWRFRIVVRLKRLEQRLRIIRTT